MKPFTDIHTGFGHTGNRVKTTVNVAVFANRKSAAPNQPSATTGGRCGGADGFEGDLRDALAGTVVREASFTEFRQVLAQFLGHLHGKPS